MISALPQQYKGPINFEFTESGTSIHTIIRRTSKTLVLIRIFIGEKTYSHLAKISNFSTVLALPKYSIDHRNGRQFSHWTRSTLTK